MKPSQSLPKCRPPVSLPTDSPPTDDLTGLALRQTFKYRLWSVPNSFHSTRFPPLFVHFYSKGHHIARHQHGSRYGQD